MAVGKEIRTQIASVKNTQKITKAMEMVAASKMKKVQEAMNKSRPYSDKIRSVINNLNKGVLEYKHPYLITRPEKNIGVIIVSTDKGLCGGLNVNLFKHFISRQFKQEGLVQKRFAFEQDQSIKIIHH